MDIIFDKIIRIEIFVVVALVTSVAAVPGLVSTALFVVDVLAILLLGVIVAVPGLLLRVGLGLAVILGLPSLSSSCYKYFIPI